MAIDLEHWLSDAKTGGVAANADNITRDFRDQRIQTLIEVIRAKDDALHYALEHFRSVDHAAAVEIELRDALRLTEKAEV